jgi:predicted MFS family arabinose efflux permease
MSQTSRYPPSFYLAITANLFFFSSFQWTFATLPGYVQALGGDAAHIGLAFGVFTLSAVAARPGVGWLTDHWGRKPVLMVGAALFALSPLLYALSGSLWPFMGARLLHGAGIAAFTTAYTALVADMAVPDRRGEAVGLSGVTNNLGLLFAPAAGLYVLTTWGYGTHFLVAAGIAAVSLLLILPVSEPARGGQPDATQPKLWEVARRRPVWAAALGGTGLAVAYGVVVSFLAPFAVERSLAAVGAFFSVFAASMMVAQALAGWLSDRVGRRAVALPGMAMTAVAMLALAAARSETTLLAAGAVFGASWGLVRAALDTTVVEAVSPDARGTALSFFYSCFDLGVGAGSFGLGLVAQVWSYAAAILAAAIWAVLALLGYLAGSRSSPGGRRPA